MITFTIEAAANMRSRISDAGTEETFVPPHLQPENISTMHSLAYKIVRQHAAKSRRGQALKVVTSDYVTKLLLKDAAQIARQSRDVGTTAAVCRQHGDCRQDPSLPKCQVCNKYRVLLKASSSIDYDEQILRAVEILQKCPDILEKFKVASQHLLVDEYQDINAAQFKLIRQLSQGQETGLFVVGDDDQSIYSWRGGNPKYIRNFSSHFRPNARIEKLNYSYRCHPDVLEGALSVLTAYDQARLPKPGFDYENRTGPKIHIYNVASDKREADEVARIADKSLPSKRVLILIPTKLFAPAIKAALKRRAVGCLSPRAAFGEGLPILNTLKDFLEDHNNNIALRLCMEQIINRGGLGVPSDKSRRPEKKQQREVALAHVSRLWEDVIVRNSTLWDALLSSQSSNLTRKIAAVMQSLVQFYKTSLEKFLCAFCQSVAPWRSPRELLSEVEEWLDNATGSDHPVSATPANLTTLQGAKGLEAEVVCIVGLEEGILPWKGTKGDELAESARVLYVSMTRAREHLYLFHARRRPASVSFQQVYGPGKPNKPTPSRFLKEIPQEHREDKFIP